MAKLNDLPTRPSIDQANVIPDVVMVHNEEKKNSIKGGIGMLVLAPQGVV